MSSSTTALPQWLRRCRGAPPNPHRPFISRQTLQQGEIDAELEFGVALKMRNFAELQRRVGEGELISRAEMAAKYFPLEADFQAVTDWLAGQGFKITRRDDSRLAVFARASIGKIQKALQVNFARVAWEGKEFTSAISAPSLPASLSPLLVGVNGLQPHLRAHKHLLPGPARPQSLTGTDPPYLPSQVAQAYQASGLYSANVTGAGQTVAIVIDTFPTADDLQQFWSTCHVNQSSTTSRSSRSSPGRCPRRPERNRWTWNGAARSRPGRRCGCTRRPTSRTITWIKPTGRFTPTRRLTRNGAFTRSRSATGWGKLTRRPAKLQPTPSTLRAWPARGVTVFASSGDGGSTPGTGSAEDTSGPVQAETPASDPNVMGVGGTSLILNSSGDTSSETAWSQSGGGTSIYFARPAWQTGPGVPAGTTRAVPDVSSLRRPERGRLHHAQRIANRRRRDELEQPDLGGFLRLDQPGAGKGESSSAGLLGPKIYPLLGTPDFGDVTNGSTLQPDGCGIQCGRGL